MNFNDQKSAPRSINDEPKILHSKVVDPDWEKKKRKFEIILLAVLVPLLLFLVITTFFRPIRASAPQSVAANPAAANQGGSGAPLFITPDKKPAEPEEEWGRSPFSLMKTGDKEESELILRGIVDDGSESYAIVGKKIIKKGDRIADKTVTEIRDSMVILKSDDGKELILKS
jgi:hypothetical protein